MDLFTAMATLQALGNDQTKKTYKNHGAQEPCYGVTLSAMKPLAKKIKQDHLLAMSLFATGNYDAANLAGMICDPANMSEADFEQWIIQANCRAICDYVVAVTLAKTKFAQDLANQWIDRVETAYRSAGWSCYCWMVGTLPDTNFQKEKLYHLLQRVVQDIHTESNWVAYAMNDFVIAVGISYLPLHKEAVWAAEQIGAVHVEHATKNCKTPLASAYIQKAKQLERIGHKRKV